MATLKTERPIAPAVAPVASPAAAPDLVPPLVPRRAAVGLRVLGEDLFLSGQFHRWDAAVISGPDLDVLTVRMAIDATSADLGALGDPAAPADLFTFRASGVHAVEPNLFRATGEITTAAGVRPLQTMIEVPAGHNAFFVLSFIVRPADVGFGWKELVSDVLALGGLDAERRLDPRLGVREPVLGAA